MTAFEEHLENLKHEKGWNEARTAWEEPEDAQEPPDSCSCKYNILGEEMEKKQAG